MKKNFKKAFTLVELLVVIAIIAVLATVSIIGYSSFQKKAAISSDTSLVKTINDELNNLEHENIFPENMFDAKEALLDNQLGIDISKTKLTKTSGYHIGYDVKQNCVVLLKSLTEADFVEAPINYVNESPLDIFVAVDAYQTNCMFSQYLTSNVTDVTLTVDKGLDAGDCATLTTVKYTHTGNAQDVLIRTNGGELEVNAPNDTVKHYGKLNCCTINQVSENSYYEYGTSRLVDIYNGRLVLTNGKTAKVSTIYLSVSASIADENDMVYNDIILATQRGATLPDIIFRDAINEETGVGKIICTIQINLDDNNTNPEKTEIIRIKGEHNVQEDTSGYQNVSPMGQILLESTTGQSGMENYLPYLQNHEVAVGKAVKDQTLIGLAEFAGGLGTSEEPWLICDRETFQNISNHYSDNTYHYWKVKDGVTTINCSNWKKVDIFGDFDGNGVVLNNLDECLFRKVDNFTSNDGFYYLQSGTEHHADGVTVGQRRYDVEQLAGVTDIYTKNFITIGNFTINANNMGTGNNANVVYSCGSELTLKDITLNGVLQGGYLGAYVAYGSQQYNEYTANPSTNQYRMHLTFDNCVCNQTITSTDLLGLYVGHCYSSPSSKVVIKDNCVVNASVYALSANSAKLCTWMNQSAFVDENDNPIANDNLSDVAVIEYHIHDASNYKVGKTLSVVANANASYAVASLFIGPNDKISNGGGFGYVYMTEKINMTDETFVTSDIKQFKVYVNAPNTTAGAYGDSYYVVNSAYSQTYGFASISIAQYNAQGVVVQLDRYAIPTTWAN